MTVRRTEPPPLHMNSKALTSFVLLIDTTTFDTRDTRPNDGDNPGRIDSSELAWYPL